ncbi:Cytochrome bo3 quinol oxidase subunit 4 [Bosea sp. 62]|uniref:cytochrome o ubiquinol oxidase subunit IV n=1 Tax=unclassified Bosea (in: a-proteobacteria) TaxID=2653178 RepID=UPI001255D7AA|nr:MULTISPECIES: cytochrome o ubiquinol oxidase subunit IV [unclassified Bosea (in: a-proteobacteria)]CAD5249015.1 Cytochrome bo3 quinol oxidase subunit 4 [Bosea sp. 46]CAD5250082.1 Cytochrome bo3 quinol oxidase subunit 4 [Bosea sp. 21B]CAD5265743.1 Cytochrome bo3 quinol oxidase subunit 4 [Bosea sp. 7B]VVT44598.1 Cytochrome bo3 quinol oxidase subunit 4 [Bosea sp. EC-HK365B]VXB06424.1 Cytochrome bo3 quinol oxidase subunit 4 [Bosea sp. 29B]
MSASQTPAEAQGGHHDAHHDGHDSHGAAHGSLRGYVTGFLLSVVLTTIPFWLVMNDVLGNSTLTAIVIMLFAAAQIVVHMVYFLHMNGRSEGGWTMLALIFTIIVVAIALAGSLWVMFHLNANMMPDMHRM